MVEAREDMLIGTLRFLEEIHQYTVEGAGFSHVVPGITEILRASGHIAERFMKQSDRDRGARIHKMIEEMNLGLLELSDIPPDDPHIGWCSAWQGVVDKLKPVDKNGLPGWDGIELPIINRKLGFATTVDCIGRFSSVEAHPFTGRPFVANIKTGVSAKVHGVQLAAEVLAYDGRRSERLRLSIEIKKSGKFRVREHDNPQDFIDFEEALLAWRDACHHPEKHGPIRLLHPLQQDLIRRRSHARRQTAD